MIVALGTFLAVVFFLLAVLHFYWAFGGKWGFWEALPTNAQDKFVLNPRTIDSAIVGCGLLFFAFFYLERIGLLPLVFSKGFLYNCGWIVPSIFLLRVLGDFRYVGLFKKVTSTKFAKRDTNYYKPLCTILAGMGYLLQLIG